eukprot:CAMPEP_0179127344 /NCGR_PEP_ID=MMETSP0796-20121207/60323_1 /TAXON_ID=73915 /ORGANISM="Pyrodinium bahamense, Strain pbaha01" /LENGTH=403 /DNA_ID=CAMNT_0020826135 /DNA_START=32 /DNA_END=1245 /DNA_ORIENTATION=-
MAMVAEGLPHSAEEGAVADLTSPAKAHLSWRNWLNLIAYILNLAVTYASLTGIFGPTNSDLSKKYQTLVTPAGFAFSIWGPIFIWEGTFAVAQMLPRFRGVAAFAQEVIPLSLVCMLGILVSLLGVAGSTDGLKMTWVEYGLLRAPFSLHLGWIIAASAVNANVQADAASASPETLLGVAVTSYAVVCIIATVFAAAMRSPDPIVCLVAAWAFNGIRAELGKPQNLNSPRRFNPHTWDRALLGGLRSAALGVTILALGLAIFAVVRRVLAERRGGMGAGENEGQAAPGLREAGLPNAPSSPLTQTELFGACKGSLPEGRRSQKSAAHVITASGHVPPNSTQRGSLQTNEVQAWHVMRPRREQPQRRPGAVCIWSVQLVRVRRLRTEQPQRRPGALCIWSVQLM